VSIRFRAFLILKLFIFALLRHLGLFDKFLNLIGL
jgi:hypothetical protein